jgi:hypothetical protein
LPLLSLTETFFDSAVQQKAENKTAADKEASDEQDAKATTDKHANDEEVEAESKKVSVKESKGKTKKRQG